MKNVRKGIIDIRGIRELFLSGNRELLVSGGTLSAIEEKDLPLVQRGPIDRGIPEIVPVEVKEGEPLVKASPNNIFVKAGSVLNGFDVTQPTNVAVQEEMTSPAPKIVTPSISVEAEKVPEVVTPVIDAPRIEPEIKKDEYDVEKAIDGQIEGIVSGLGIKPEITPEPLSLETPSTFEKSEFPSTPIPTFETPKPVEVDKFISINANIEAIRSEINKKIAEIKIAIADVEKVFNTQLDEISRSVETARQMSQNDLSAVQGVVQNEINSLYNVAQSQTDGVKR